MSGIPRENQPSSITARSAWEALGSRARDMVWLEFT